MREDEAFDLSDVCGNAIPSACVVALHLDREGDQNVNHCSFWNSGNSLEIQRIPVDRDVFEGMLHCLEFL